MSANRYLILGATSTIGQHFCSTLTADSISLRQYKTPRDLPTQSPRNNKTEWIQCDFTSSEQVDDFIEILDRYPPFNRILISHSLPLINSKFRLLPWEQVQNRINAEIRPIFSVLQNQLPKLATNGGGKIIVLLSKILNGTIPKFMYDYAIAKYGIHGLISSASQEYKNKNIDIYSLSPGLFESKIWANIDQRFIEMAADQNFSVANDVIPVISAIFAGSSNYEPGENIFI